MKGIVTILKIPIKALLIAVACAIGAISVPFVA